MDRMTRVPTFVNLVAKWPRLKCSGYSDQVRLAVRAVVINLGPGGGSWGWSVQSLQLMVILIVHLETQAYVLHVPNKQFTMCAATFSVNFTKFLVKFAN